MAGLTDSLSDAFEEAAQEALLRTALELDAQFTDEISNPKWNWPNEPSPRDIVDTGRLRASQTRVVNPDASITFSWPVEHATTAHDGGFFVGSEQPFPGRPWTELPLSRLPDIYNRNLEKALEDQR